MSDISGMGNPKALGKSEDTPQADAVDQSTRNWEERLAIARSEREKNLKAKGKPLSKPAMKRPSFMDDDPSANWDLNDPEPEAEHKAQRPVAAPVTQTAQADPNAAGAPPADTRSTAQAQPVANSNSVSVSWVVIVAFACFFGLGAGIVLSIGAVVAMGWVSLSDLAPQRMTSQTIVSPQAPEIYTAVFKPLSPPLARASQISLQYDALKPVVAEMRGVPSFFAVQVPDAGLAAVQSPAPRLDTSGVADALVSRQDFQPASIAMTFATPLPSSASPPPFEIGGRSGDVLPELFEKSDIRPMTYLSDLSSPGIETAIMWVASIEQGLQRPLKGPALVKSVPETMPQVTWAHLDKPDIFDDAITSISATAPKGLDTIVLASLMDVPPARSLRAAAPVTEVPDVSLPIVGKPHIYNPSLAARLGLTRDIVERVSLVTFAPGNVSDETLEANSELLRATGLPVSKVNRVNFKVSRTHVRYYRNRDEDLARALADEVGGIARNFSTARNRPPSGQIEVWLQGNRKGLRTTSTPRRSVSAAQRQAAAKARLENRLVNSLRRGEHLGGASR